jgi:Mg-chelatase subunit ChlD
MNGFVYSVYRQATVAAAVVLGGITLFSSPWVVSPAMAQGECGCMDVAFIVDDTGSMGPAIDNVKTGLNVITAAVDTASGGDFRMALVSFSDTIEVDQDYTSSIATIQSAVNSLVPSGGGNEPEASDEALNLVVTGASACAVSGSLGAGRPECLKLAIVVTDARPAGCDDSYVAGVDDVNAANVANAAVANGWSVSAVDVLDGRA